jgi:hypothetical protein
MKMMGNKILIALMGLSMSACVSTQKNYEYMSDSNYQSKPGLSESLMNDDEQYSEASIQEVLNRKIVMPKKITLAVLKLNASGSGGDFQILDQEIADQFYKLTNWGKRVQSIVPIPQVMLSSQVNLKSIRQSAVRLQADAVVIIKPMSYGDWKFDFLDKKAKGITTLEVLVLDTRTGLIPYTSLVSESAEILKAEEDFGTSEFVSRAKKTSEKRALLKVAPQVEKFLTQTL